jgi:hypothetical protein
MSDKPQKQEQQTQQSSQTAGEGTQGKDKGLAERSVTEHHIEGADGFSGAEAEEDNNP